MKRSSIRIEYFFSNMSEEKHHINPRLKFSKRWNILASFQANLLKLFLSVPMSWAVAEYIFSYLRPSEKLLALSILLLFHVINVFG